jgi:hypothetical protein
MALFFVCYPVIATEVVGKTTPSSLNTLNIGNFVKSQLTIPWHGSTFL